MYIGLWLPSARHVSTLLHPHCTPRPSPYIYKTRALVREGGRAGERADAQGSRSLSPSRTLVNPYCKRIRPGRRTTRGRGFPLLFSPLCSVSRRPIWAGTRSDNLLVGPGTPRVETPTEGILRLRSMDEFMKPRYFHKAWIFFFTKHEKKGRCFFAEG
jgi:hypothetical protein